MATYTDNFNRANGNVSAAANWAVGPFSSTELVISSNAVVNDKTSSGYVTWEGAGTWGRTQESEITLGAAGGNRIAPMAYVTASGAYRVEVRPSNGSIQFEKINSSGSATLLGAGESAGGALSPGDTVKIRVEDDGGGGTTISGYYNGALVATRTDSDFTSGKVGFYLEAFDTSSVDTWEGNDFEAAATATVTTTVTDQSDTALANETGVAWYWTDTFGGDPTDSGSSETTDASGELVVDLVNTGLSSGQAGYLAVKLSNGDVGVARETLD